MEPGCIHITTETIHDGDGLGKPQQAVLPPPQLCLYFFGNRQRLTMDEADGLLKHLKRKQVAAHAAAARGAGLTPLDNEAVPTPNCHRLIYLFKMCRARLDLSGIGEPIHVRQAQEILQASTCRVADIMLAALRFRRSVLSFAKTVVGCVLTSAIRRFARQAIL